MSVATQSFLMLLISMCLFSGILIGSIYAVACLVSLRSVNDTKILAAQAITGFVLPLVMLLIWERILSEVVSFNIISIIWLLLITISVASLTAKSSVFVKVRSYASGLLLGCCAFFMCGIYLAMLD
jgi:hypothetical protein